MSLLGLLDEDSRRRLREQPHPEWTAPMLAVLTDDRFSDPDRIFERKLDGVRVQAFRKGREIRLLSRDREVHRVTPDLVGQFGFTEWTGDGKLRHPRYLGLRRDKDPRDVVRERPS